MDLVIWLVGLSLIDFLICLICLYIVIFPIVAILITCYSVSDHYYSRKFNKREHYYSIIGSENMDKLVSLNIKI